MTEVILMLLHALLSRPSELTLEEVAGVPTNGPSKAGY